MNNLNYHQDFRNFINETFNQKLHVFCDGVVETGEQQKQKPGKDKPGYPETRVTLKCNFVFQDTALHFADAFSAGFLAIFVLR